MKNFIAIIAFVFLFALATAPISAQTIDISGNGADSTNDVSVEENTNVDIDQSNNADINNNVDVDCDTGNNEANRNTGGDVSIATGDCETDVSILNEANKNVITTSASPNPSPNPSASPSTGGGGDDKDDDNDDNNNGDEDDGEAGVSSAQVGGAQVLAEAGTAQNSLMLIAGLSSLSLGLLKLRKLN